MAKNFQLRTLLTLFFGAIFAYIVSSAWTMPIQAKLFPLTIGTLSLVLLAWTLFKELRPSTVTEDGETGADMAFSADEATREGRLKALELFGWLYGFVMTLWLLGFLLSIPLMIMLFLLRHRESTKLTVILPIATWLLTWGLFDELLHLPLPEGFVFEWLGWV